MEENNSIPVKISTMSRNQRCVNPMLTLTNKIEKPILLYHVVSYVHHIYVIDFCNDSFKQK